jgi:hypothetical protein
MSIFKKDCPCPKTSCERHGYCELCEAHHKRNKPYCKRKKYLKKLQKLSQIEKKNVVSLKIE